MELLGYTVWDSLLPEITSKYRIINTLNAHSFEMAKRDMIFKKALKESDILLPDGIGIVWAASLLMQKRIRKIAGSDLHYHILRQLQERNSSCFYLGSSELTLNLIVARLKNEFPGIRVGHYSPPYRDSFSDEENNEMVEKINSFKPEVLFVGMTAPKQEKWVAANHHEIHAKTICSIGAVFDFFAETVKRPGPFWIKTGLEFLPRMIKEPRRMWRRNFISTPAFLFDILIYKHRQSS